MTKLAALLILFFAVLTPASGATAVAPGSVAATGIGCISTRYCTPSHGGAFMVTTRNSCTAALPVRDRRTGAWYVLTAGHCVAKAAGARWRQSGLTLGIGTRWEYGATDAGLIRYTANGWIWRAGSRVIVVGRSVRGQRITSIKVARAGERVCVTAGRSGVTRCGTVVAARTSLRYASPGLAARTISNLVMVNGICLQPGDSGSPVFAGGSFAGIAVAKANTGCTMWYTRADVAFARLGVKLG
ncbi:MAG TPA: S1 family peptidase [Mycobacteriales bacterium]